MRATSRAFFLTLLILAMSAVCAFAGTNPEVEFTTTKGDIVIELYPDKAPITVDNFLAYVNSGFYQGTIFHRVIPGFVIQGGGMDKNLDKKRTMDPITNEADNGLKNARYTLSMARTMDPNSATSQFFINLTDNKTLDHTGKTMGGWGYAVFGKVIKGQDVVDQIAKVTTTNRGRYKDVPFTPVEITGAKVIKK